MPVIPAKPGSAHRTITVQVGSGIKPDLVSKITNASWA
jgi:hypothetical protein